MYFRDRRDLEERSLKAAVDQQELGDGTTLCTILGSIKMFADTHDRIITPHMKSNGFWEAWIALLFTRLIKPGDVCLDVGANQGYYALLMAAQSGPAGFVAAIEPISKLCKLIDRSAVANAFDWLHAFNYAASNSSGIATLWVTPGEDSNSSFEKNANNAIPTSVPMTTLDTMFASLDHVDFIKIDAEGAEPLILEGMQKIISRSPNLRICLEWDPNRFSNPMSLLRKWKKQFKIELCDTNGFAVKKKLRPLTKLKDLEMLLLTRK